MTRFGPALGIANAVLYEGYLLYPYTASAPKNRLRWQFGVVVPQAYAATGTGEPAEQQTEVLFEGGGEVEVAVRFLHVEARQVEAGCDGNFTPVDSLDVEGTRHLTFEEGVERTVEARLDLSRTAQYLGPIALDAGEDVEELRDAGGTVRGRIVRRRWELRGTLTIVAESAADAPSLTKLRVLVRNQSEFTAGGSRDVALRTSFISCHTLLAATAGQFLSTLDPPEAAGTATAGLANRNTWPVLVGGHDGDRQRASLVLSSPIILYDFPAVNAQTDSDAFDATEIDELLTLSVLSLPDAERAEARATDPRARAIVERAERFGAAELGRLHGEMFAGDPFGALDVPSIDCVFVDGIKVTRGSTVRLRPNRRADVWDAFLVGKTATVRAVHQDFEGQLYVAVTVDDDPASDLHEWYGRSLFFYPDEIEL